MLLTEMTSRDIDALPRDIVVVYPVASCEQHSLHLPVFVDTMINEAVTRGVHEQIPNDVLVLPCQYLGFSHHHIKFPGTLTSTTETFMTMMEETIESLRVHGFRKFLIVNSHGGNSAPVSVLLQRLMMKYDQDQAEIYTRFAWARNLDGPGMRTLGGAGSGHAGETETSMIMHLRPDLVKMDQLDADGMDSVKPGGAIYGATDYQRMDQKTMHGGVGDPRPSTAAAGKAMIDASIADVVKTVQSIKAAEPFVAFAERKKEKHRGLWRRRPKL